MHFFSISSALFLTEELFRATSDGTGQARAVAGLPVLMELVTAAKEPDFAGAEKLESLREKVQNRVNTLLNLHVMLSDQRKADLLQCDIKIDLPSDNAEGEGSE